MVLETVFGLKNGKGEGIWRMPLRMQLGLNSGVTRRWLQMPKGAQAITGADKRLACESVVVS